MIQTHYLQSHDQTQVEVQFSGSVANDRLGWVAGAFYFDSTSRAYNTTQFDAFDFVGLLPNFTADDGYSTDNVPGKLEGFELEVTATPIDNLLLSLSAGQNKFTNDDLDPTSSTYRNPNYRSQPEWNASLGGQYAAQLANGGRLTPRLDAFYQDDRHNGPSNAIPGIQGVIANVCPQQCVPGYTIYNLRLTYEPPSSDWRLSLSGTNVTDKFYWQQVGPEIVVNSTTGAISNPVGRAGVASRPREWAVSMEKRF